MLVAPAGLPLPSLNRIRYARYRRAATITPELELICAHVWRRLVQYLPLVSDLAFWFILPRVFHHNTKRTCDALRSCGVPAGTVNKYAAFNLTAAANSYFTRSYISTVRYFPLATMQEQYSIVAKVGLRTTVLWGTNDLVIPFSTSTYVRVSE